MDRSDSGDEEKEYVINWQHLVSEIQLVAKEAYEAHAKLVNPSPEKTQECLRDVYSRRHSILLNDTSIPTYATSPPIHNFHILLFNSKERPGCPCCLPDVSASIEVCNDSGVTKDDILRELISYLYDTSPPQIYNTDGFSVAQGGTTVHNSDWMITGTDDNGGDFAYVNDWSYNHEVVKLFLYCCKVGDFPQVEENCDKEK